MILKLKIIIKFIVCFCINLFIKSPQVIKQNSLLLVRLDAIGDYVLFRNYIEIIKQNKYYENYSITLLGNNLWKNLSEELDSQYVDEFIWLDRMKFLKDYAYRYKKLQEIASIGYEIVLVSAYSRDYFIEDSIVQVINSKEKIGSRGNISNIQQWQKNISDKYYDRLIEAKDKVIFEFDRNKDFFEIFLQTKLEIKKPRINLQPKKLSFELPQNYLVLFIGASVNYRKWSIESFAKIGEYLHKNYGYEIVLCGAPSDTDDALKFKEFFSGNYIDLVGKTSLIELLYVLHNGNLMIANETSAPHFAVALEMTNIFVISNGNHYGRFTPYPKDIAPNYHTIYHPFIEKTLDDYEKLSNKFRYGSDLNIEEINVEMVKNKVNNTLKMKQSKYE